MKITPVTMIKPIIFLHNLLYYLFYIYNFILINKEILNSLCNDFTVYTVDKVLPKMSTFI